MSGEGLVNYLVWADKPVSTPAPMAPEVKAAWLGALRSGEYKQGQGQLRSPEGLHCCLGVLCDLHRKEKGGAWCQMEGSLEGDLGYLGQTVVLPPVVADWAGLEFSDPRLPQEPGEPYARTLSYENDNGVSFAKIADLIQAHL